MRDFGDATLREMARIRDHANGRISGVGVKKLDEFGAQFTDAIVKFLRENPRQVFAAELNEFRGPPPRPFANASARESWDLFVAGRSPAEIAQVRAMNPRTVIQHLAEMIAAGHECDLRRFFTADQQARMEAAFAKLGLERLAPVMEALGDSIDYDALNVCRAAIQARLRAPPRADVGRLSPQEEKSLLRRLLRFAFTSSQERVEFGEPFRRAPAPFARQCFRLRSAR